MMTFHVDHLFNGQPAPDNRYWARLRVEKKQEGLLVSAVMPDFPEKRVPEAPSGRLDGLWEYDVAELFLVGDDGHYVEVELGTNGHYLVLAFDAVRHRSDDFVDRSFVHHMQKGEGEVSADILLPNDVLPEAVVRANAFLIAGGQFFSASPVPGEKADFHQPSTFPVFSL